MFCRIVVVALLLVAFHLITCKSTTKSTDKNQRSTMPIGNVSKDKVKDPAKLDADLIAKIHSGNRNLLGIGMLSPSRILVIVDEYFSKLPSDFFAGVPPETCCNPADYYVFECQVPAVTKNTKNFSRQFPLSGAVLLSKKWPQLFKKLKDNFVKKIWVRFFIIQNTGKTNFLIVWSMDSNADQPMFAMNLKSGLVTSVANPWYTNVCRSPISRMSSVFYTQDCSYTNSNSEGHTYLTTLKGDNPSKSGVTQKKYTMCAEKPLSTGRLSMYEFGCPLTTTSLKMPFLVGFSDGVTGIYLFNWYAIKTWAMAINPFNNGSRVNWKDNLNISQILILGTGGSNKNIVPSGNGTGRSLELGHNWTKIFGLVGGLFIIAFAGAAIYCIFIRKKPEDDKATDESVNKDSKKNVKGSSAGASVKSRSKKSSKGGRKLSKFISRKTKGKSSSKKSISGRKGRKISKLASKKSAKGKKLSWIAGSPSKKRLSTGPTVSKSSKKKSRKLSGKLSKRLSKKRNSMSSKKGSNKLSKYMQSTSAAARKGGKKSGKMSGKRSKSLKKK